MAPRIFIISIVLDAQSYLKSIETHAGAFFKVIIFSIGSVIIDKLDNVAGGNTKTVTNLGTIS